jgi:hypothetical protein
LPAATETKHVAKWEEAAEMASENSMARPVKSAAETAAFPVRAAHSAGAGVTGIAAILAAVFSAVPPVISAAETAAFPVRAAVFSAARAVKAAHSAGAGVTGIAAILAAKLFFWYIMCRIISHLAFMWQKFLSLTSR